MALTLILSCIPISSCGDNETDDGYVSVSEYITSYDPNAEYTMIYYDFNNEPIFVMADDEAGKTIIKNTEAFWKDHPEYAVYGFRSTYDIYRYSTESKALEKVPLTLSEGKYDAIEINDVAATPNGEYIIYGNLFTIADPIFSKRFCIKAEPNAGSVFLDTDYYGNDPIIVDANGYTYIQLNYLQNYENIEELKILDPDLNNFCTIKTGLRDSDMILDGDGNLRLVQSLGMEYYFYGIDLESKTVAEVDKRSLPLIEKRLFGTNGEIYGYNSIGLYSCSNDDKASQTNISSYDLLFDWVSAGIDYSSIQNVVLAADGSAYVEIAIASDMNEVYRVSRVPKSEAPKRITIRVALENTIYYESCRNTIISELAKINRQSDKYRVEFVYYSDTNGGLTPTQQLGRDMSSKDKLIDLVIFNNSLSYPQIADQNLFCDLGKYLQKDPNYNKKTLYPFVYEAYSHKGQYCYIAFESSATTIYANTDIVGNITEWSLSDIRRINSELAEDEYLASFSFSPTPNDKEKIMLIYFGRTGLINDFIDYDNGKCDFTGLSELFELCKEAKILDSSNMNIAEIAKEKIALEFTKYNDIISYIAYKENSEDNMVEIGYPGIDKKSSGASIQIGLGIGISKSSKHKDESWDIICKLISGIEERNLSQNSFSYCDFSLPMTKASLENISETLKNYNVSYNRDTSYDYEKYYIINGLCHKKESHPSITSRSYLKSEEVPTDIESSFCSLEHQYVRNSKIYNIISEEASYYFSGTKTLDETIKIIEDRVSMLVAE